jgi:hypothetical protein
MYSPAQVVAASLIGSPRPAFYVLAQNYRAAKQPTSARFMLVVGIIVTVLLMTMALILPDNTPFWTVTLFCAICTHQIAKLAQGTLMADHLAAGGRISSWWVAIGVGFLGLLVNLAVIFGLAWMQLEK